jgi:hypothetical protein
MTGLLLFYNDTDTTSLEKKIEFLGTRFGLEVYIPTITWASSSWSVFPNLGLLTGTIDVFQNSVRLNLLWSTETMDIALNY